MRQSILSDVLSAMACLMERTKTQQPSCLTDQWIVGL